MINIFCQCESVGLLFKFRYSCNARTWNVLRILVYSWLNDASSSLYCIVSNVRMINERWVGKDVSRSGRGLIWSSILATVSGGWGHSRNPSVSLSGLLTKPWIRDVPSITLRYGSCNTFVSVCRLHGVVSQKTPISIFVVVGISHIQDKSFFRGLRWFLAVQEPRSSPLVRN